MADNTATNDVTGDRIATKRSTTYADNYANIDFTIKLDNETNGKKEHFNHLLKDTEFGFNKE
jgi:hypothetical protein